MNKNVSIQSNRFAIRSTRVVFTADNTIRPATLVIENGKFESICGYEEEILNAETVDVQDLVCMPGVIDPHVHINEPGRTDWEGFEHATKAAAAGGITTVVDMPLNCLPVTTTKHALSQKLRAVENKLWIDCAFWGGVVPQSVQDLKELLNSGVMGVKSFLIDSGIPEFPEMTRTALAEAMPIITQSGLPYLIHAELNQHTLADQHTQSQTNYEDFLNSRPRSWENDAIELMIQLCKQHKTKIHIVHLSNAESLKAIQTAKNEGLPITVETCPHYLTFTSENIQSDANKQALFKCCPPIRDLENREHLWKGLYEKTIDFIASDHSPCTIELKKMDASDLSLSWGGISSLQFSLPIVWSEGNKRGLSLLDISRLLSENPARFLKIHHQKGRIAKGLDADFILWDPNEEFQILPEHIFYKNKFSPYTGMNVRGVVHHTFVRGKQVFANNQFSTTPFGQPFLKPKDAHA